MLIFRSISKSFVSVQREGVGATVRRSIGRPMLRRLSTRSLMLDEFHVQLPGRFPDHPHRGFETITYLVPHSPSMMLHEDFCGHRCELAPGDLQWMCSGRGIIHSEMPASCNKPMIGLQFWLNLPKLLKMTEPKYQEIPAKGLPRVIVIAGQAMGATATVFTNVPITYVHFIFSGAASHSHALSKDHNAFVYIISGEGSIGGSRVEPHSVGLLSADGNEDGVTLETTGEMQCVGLSGKPINEPINSSTVHLP